MRPATNLLEQARTRTGGIAAALAANVGAL